MNVFILCSSIIPNGGTERAVSNVSKLLLGVSNVDVKIISICSSSEEEPAFDFYCPVIHLRQPQLQISTFGKILWYKHTISLLKTMIKDERPDVVLGIGHNISIMLPFIASNTIRTYACEHINFLTIPGIYRWIINRVYPKLSGVIVLSEKAREKLKKTNTNIYIIPNSISFDGNQTSDLSNTSMIMVGRISPEKGYDRLPKIATLLKENLPQWHINIYGDGPDKDKIDKMINQNDLSDYVTFHGVVSDIQNKYANNSILLLTSYTEALPMAIIEANACGVPVVAYENEGVEALVKSGHNGFIIPTDDYIGFSSKVIQIATNPNMLRLLSENSFESSKQFSEENIQNKWKELLIE